MHFTGNLVNAFFICKRKFWLYARQCNPDPDTDLLLLGRMLSEDAYPREKKEVSLEGMKIDLIRREGGHVVVGEVKRSSKGLKAAMMQVAFYLKSLRDKGVFASGEIMVPKERKRMQVSLTEELERELVEAMNTMETIANDERPPAPLKTQFCRKCAFFEFCFS